MRKLLVAITIGLTSLTHANPDPDQVARARARQAAEQLLKDAGAARDDAKYAACGQAFLDLFNKDPRATDGDELLYNAATCFRLGRSVGAAIQANKLLLRQFPASRLAPKALISNAQAFYAIASYAEAAALFEDYAKKYAGEKEALDALSNAIAARTAVGDDARRVQNTSYAIKVFGRKRPDIAASAMFALLPVHERAGVDQAVKHLRGYLRMFGARGGVERLVLAHAKIGELLWTKSCPVRTVDGLCLKRVRDKVPAKARCEPSVTPRLAVVARRAAGVREARAALEQAVRAYETARSTDAGALHAYAMAKLALADAELEAMLATPFPTKLDFSPGRDAARRRSTKRFNDWVREQQAIGKRATDQYSAVLALKDPQSAIVAAARLGQLSQGFARALVSGEIPRDIRTGEFAKEKHAVYCDKLREVAEPLEARAVEAFTVCVHKAAEFGVHDAWSRTCLREGHVMDPKTFPAATAELHAEPAMLVMPTLPEPAVPSRANDPAAFAAALARFRASDQAGWTPRACRKSAAELAAVARRHKGPDALYMAGLSFHRCGLATEARGAYAKVLARAPDHAATRSNLAELDWRAGNHGAARTAWEQAIKSNARLFGARIGLAAALHRQQRSLAPADPQRKRLEGDLELHLQSALAIDPSDATPLVMLAVLAADAGGATKLELARFLLADAEQRSPRRASVHHARGVVAARAGNWIRAVRELEEAARLAPSSQDVQLAAGLALVRVRRFADAGTRLASVRTPSYDLHVARGVVARGLGRLAEAETAYRAAVALDPSRAAAHYNLGLLDEHYRTSALTDPTLVKAALQRAAVAYRRAAAIDPRLDAAARAAALDKRIAAMP